MRRVLCDEPGFEIVGEANELERTVHAVRRKHPDVLVLALALPDGSRIAAIDAMRARVRPTVIVFATMESNPEFAESALEAGAVAFVSKDRADVELAHAVRAAARGAPYVSSLVAEQLRARQRPTAEACGPLSCGADRASVRS